MDTYQNFIQGEWPLPEQKRRRQLNPANTETRSGASLSTRDEARAASKPPPAPSQVARHRGRCAGRSSPRRPSSRSARRASPDRPHPRGEEAPARGARRDQKAVNILDFMAGEARRMNGQTIPSELPLTLAYTVAAAARRASSRSYPWNFPICIPAWKIAPPSSRATPASSAGDAHPGRGPPHPRLPGRRPAQRRPQHGPSASGRDVGEEFTTHPTIKAISFTGSNEVGGAHSPARRPQKGPVRDGRQEPHRRPRRRGHPACRRSHRPGAPSAPPGQRCTATSPRRRRGKAYDKFVSLLVERAKRGSGRQPCRAVDGHGPPPRRRPVQDRHSYIDFGTKDGAADPRRQPPHRRPARPWLLHRSYDLRPRQPTMRIAHEEIFGPVLSVLPREGLRMRRGRQRRPLRPHLPPSTRTTARRSSRSSTGSRPGSRHVNSPTMGRRRAAALRRHEGDGRRHPRGAASRSTSSPSSRRLTSTTRARRGREPVLTLRRRSSAGRCSIGESKGVEAQRTLIKGGTVVSCAESYRADVVIEGSGSTRSAPSPAHSTRRSMPPGNTSCPAPSTSTPTSTYPSGLLLLRRFRDRHPGRPSAARPRSWTSPSRRGGRRSARASTAGTRRPSRRPARTTVFTLYAPTPPRTSSARWTRSWTRA